MPIKRGTRWEGRLKIGGQVVKTKRFDTKRAALAWEQRARAGYDDTGYNPSQGKVTVEVMFDEWLRVRADDDSISENTHALDRHLKGYLPIWLLKLNVNAVNDEHIRRWLKDLRAIKTGESLAPTSKQRLRGNLSSFFGWLVGERFVRANPVAATKPPKDTRVREGIRPFPEDELNEVVAAVTEIEETYGHLVKVLAWTGARWGEARAITVADFVRAPTPMLRVNKNQPEGVSLRATKSGKPRHVGIANEVLPLIEAFCEGKEPEEWLFTAPGGGQLWRSPFIRRANWDELGRGRTLHDLRHTAACLWLINHVPLGTVQAWLGHASITMTSHYLHHIGDTADKAALELLNNRDASLPSRH